MTPVLNYDQALTLWAIDVVGAPFAWGKTDCASLVRRAMKVVFARDVFRGKVRTYRSGMEAFRVLHSLGGYAGALETAGFRRVRPGKWLSGDVIVLPRSARSDGPGPIGVIINHKLLTADHHQGVYWRMTQQLPRRVRRYRLVGDGK